MTFSIPTKKDNFNDNHLKLFYLITLLTLTKGLSMAVLELTI